MNSRQTAVTKSVIKIMKYTHIHIYHGQSQNSPPKIKYGRLTQRTKEIKNYIYQLRTKLTKAQTENKTKARCPVVNKTMKQN